MIPGNETAREAIDLYNNEVGRKIAVANPDASREEFADLVAEARSSSIRASRIAAGVVSGGRTGTGEAANGLTAVGTLTP